MFFRSGRNYSPDHLDIEAKLDLILKEPQDLKLKVEGLENKNKDKSSRYDTRDRRENTHRRRDDEDDITHRIKIDPLTFDGIFHPKTFSDWMADIDYYFDCYKFIEESKIWLARMRFTGPARIYWTLVKRVHEAWGFYRVLRE